jgi:hypothetical protein
MCGMSVADRLAWAQDAVSPLRSRTTHEPIELTAVPSGGPSPLWGLAISMLLALAVVAVSLIPSKRGHQD